MIQLKNIIPANTEVPIMVIGAGGTGSHVVRNLAVLNDNMIKLGFPGLDVVVMDFDTVSKTNVGRQEFTYDDIGLNKALVLVDRINYEYGFNWEAIPERVVKTSILRTSHCGFLISCVDNVETRKLIDKLYNNKNFYNDSMPKIKGYEYWMDIGNGKDYGQIILGSYQYKIPTIFQVFPNLETMERKSNDDSIGCSTMDAMSKQSLFINKLMALYAINMLKEYLFNSYLNYSMIFINLETLEINAK